jgi:hypothetical protein
VLRANVAEILYFFDQMFVMHDAWKAASFWVTLST